MLGIKHDLLVQLSRSKIFKDYQTAFTAATKLPLQLRPPNSLGLAEMASNANPFCALLARSNKGCRDCLRVQGIISDPTATGAASSQCFAGLCDTAVPIRVGEKLLGFLQTGQVAFSTPSAAKFKRISRQLVEWGAVVDLKRLEDAYFHSNVLDEDSYSGAVRLLEIFASHIGIIGNQLVIHEESDESPFTKRARAYVASHQADPIDLKEVSQALHVSTFYFCKMFKKATGVTFTDYLSRVRIERAKTLLLNRNARVSEVAYAVGFGSLTHFNRMFHRLVGVSPSEYRVAPQSLMNTKSAISR